MIGVFVHESEVLEMDFLVSHPVVKVYTTIYIVHLFLKRNKKYTTNTKVGSLL